jgi:hypothetical protein
MMPPRPAVSAFRFETTSFPDWIVTAMLAAPSMLLPPRTVLTYSN